MSLVATALRSVGVAKGAFCRLLSCCRFVVESFFMGMMDSNRGPPADWKKRRARTRSLRVRGQTVHGRGKILNMSLPDGNVYEGGNSTGGTRGRQEIS